MTIRVALHHRTTYRFDRAVALSPHVIRLRPAPHCRTHIEAYSLDISGDDHFVNWQQDPFGNFNARVVFPTPRRELTIAVELIAPMTVINPFDFFLDDIAQTAPFVYPDGLKGELGPYLEVEAPGPKLAQWLSEVDKTPITTVDFLVAINQRLQRDISYLVRMEPGVQSCEETLTLGSGSCRDSAWLLVQIFRHLGLAARFVSGYLIQLVPDVKALDDGPSGTEVDFTDLHAWTEVFLPGAGWVGLDPTSGLFAGEGHIPLAATPTTGSAAAITGFSEKCEVSFDVEMRVERIHEDARVTKPYSDAQWANIVALGDQVDAELQKQDVRLTMGGEPTFVSIDDMESPQWNIDALGAHKRERAEALLTRLQAAYSDGGVVQQQQGKWYPGEPLPRWALACYWRKDGKPLWRDPKWLACMADAPSVHANEMLAKSFTHALAERLGLEPRFWIPAFEDAYYYLWKEQTLPVNIDPREANLKDDAERRRLARLLERGLGAVVGYALPLRHSVSQSHRWETGRWPIKRDHLYLTPGDSPMGLRLPLSALPWADPDDQPKAQSVFAPRAEIGDIHGEVARRHAEQHRFSSAERFGQSTHTSSSHPEGESVQQQPSAEEDRGKGVVHTSLCVEPRDGRLHIFLPPLTHLEHYLDLLGSIEECAKELGCPVMIEGYAPPRDPRLESFMITPDPGVIEVNIMPAASWQTLVAQTERLYEEARLSRLGTEKFMLDGRHTGTGGGNHVTLGGITPDDSPFLRRPDLLASLVTYWQHHPSLSYLFSGLFIGPTSQAPRVDEARHEALYELEIALSQMPVGEVVQPWLVDRLLRHLLTDLTGNTHRAEFCIDKLYSPDSDSGRLGLLELRGFEMPPHARMGLMQMLLIRALVARHWKAPYRARPVRWGSALQDRWMLPHYLWEDLSDVLGDLRHHGFHFELDWFEPFRAFRFPVHGRLTTSTLDIELRQAIEPWHVLGEEATAGGTARYVDSSVERLEVKVSGMSDERYIVTCNGRRVPLKATGRSGEAVAGVRYRAWQPPSALHPHIPIHAPLVFDVIDTWNERSVAGCTYHVVHPTGRNFEHFPVNAFEAEARRLGRFIPGGHTHGFQMPDAELPSHELPLTLDLRRRPS
ncbi:transglutaminase family protein [Halomonas sp. PAMB 3264]|uniref:transglutaminase family protein n=1 Tax=Halomonas sp. PAMB 3264 TaxID=3075222 RepID=UPI0028A14A2D|nr:transglutaminase family protein [Halomonas sp. PAMB 3264]WNL43270.1 transglutaminase family protein [Halomonas sp. PAMB 3264]